MPGLTCWPKMMKLLRSISIIEIKSSIRLLSSWPALLITLKTLIYHYLLIVDPNITIVITLFAPKTSLDNIEMFRIPTQQQWAFCWTKTRGILKIDYLLFLSLSRCNEASTIFDVTNIISIQLTTFLVKGSIKDITVSWSNIFTL